MSDSNESKNTPWHLWTVGIVSLLWNAMGAMDFVMTQTKNEAYMSAFTPEQLEFFYGFPIWVVTAWGIAVWGAVIGSILLLLRKTLAVWVFLISFLSMVITSIHNFVFSNGLEAMGGLLPLIFTAVIFIVGLGLFIYARKMNQNGFLN